MNSQVRGLFVPVAAAALLLGGAQVSQAQGIVNFVDTNVTLTYLNTVSGTPTVTPVGNSITAAFPANGANESYVMNASGTLDAATRDGSGAGAFIRLSPAGNGIRDTSFQNTVLNNSLINYRFNITLLDINSGLSSTVALPFTYNSAFNEGSNGGDGVTAFTLPAPRQIGNDIFTFSLFAFTPPSAPPVTGGPSLTDGSFSLRVQVAAVPEPGTVAMLVGMGVSGSAFVLRKRRAVK